MKKEIKKFLASLFTERSYKGLKYQLLTNTDTQKLFKFAVGDGHSNNVSLNFLC